LQNYKKENSLKNQGVRRKFRTKLTPLQTLMSVLLLNELNEPKYAKVIS